MKRKSSLHRTLIIILAFAVIVPVSVIGFIGIRLMYNSLDTEISDRNELLTVMMTNQIEEYLGQPMDDLLSMIDFFSGPDFDTRLVSSYLDSTLESHDYFLKLQVIDTNGAVSHVSPYDRDILGLDMSGRDLFQITKKTGKPFWSSSFISPQFNQPVVTLSVPSKIGIITAYFSLIKIGELVKGMDIGTDSYITITDQRGTFIAHTDESYVLTQVKDKNYNKFRKEDQGSLRRQRIIDDGTEWICTIKFISQTGWAVVIYQSKEELFSPIQSIIKTFTFITVLLLLGVVFLAVWVLRRIMAPLRHFLNATREVSSGSYDVVIAESGYREFEELGLSFNKMAISVMQREGELVNVNKDLDRLQSYLKNIINSMPSILIGVDLDKKVTMWNVEAEKTTGIAPGKAIGRHISGLFPQFKNQIRNINRSIKTRKSQKIDNVTMIKDKQIHHTEIMIYPLEDVDIKGAVIRIDDVTEKVKLQEIMIQTEKMMSVGGLAAGMAHEINNPLAGIIQSTQNILRRILSDLPGNIQAAEQTGVKLDKITSYLEKRDIITMLNNINDCGSRAAYIVSNMLQFSRKSESVLVPTDLSTLIDTAVELASNDYDLKKRFDFRDIEIIKDYDLTLKEVPCIKTQIEQVILNLLKNGAQTMNNKKYKDHMPRFHLRTRRIKERALLEVEDNGPGMDESIKKRIFEPFFTTKNVGEGTGLGLSISYFIITNNHKGTMEVESTPGTGTKFIIGLPLKNA